MNEPPRGFRLLGKITKVEVIATGHGVRQSRWLKRTYGGARWRKLKGIARVETDNGWIGDAEIHWYEAHGVGKVRWKIKHRF